MSPSDVERDRLLTEVHSDIKHLVKWTEAHAMDDKENFRELRKSQEFIKKVVYGGIGVIAFIEFISRFIK